MSYIQQSLSTNEHVVNLFSLHWSAWIPAVATGTLGIVVGAAMLMVSSLAAIVGVLTLGLVAFGLALGLLFIEQGVTNKRVVLKTGVIGRQSDEMKLSSIETVEIDQDILGRLLGYGSITITGKGVSSVVFKNVADPILVKRQIESVSNPID